MKQECIFTYVSVLCSDSYAPGIIALAHSLRKVKSKYPLVVLILESVSDSIIQKIRKIADVIIDFNRVIVPQELLSDNISDFKKWNNTFFKLCTARLIQFTKIVLLDADMIVKKNIDELFDFPSISCTSAGEMVSGRVSYEMNSGLMVIEPSEQLYQRLVEAVVPAKRGLGNRPFGDQDVFRYAFPEWPKDIGKKISETYNCYATEIDELVSRKLMSFSDIKVVHYAMVKPWIVSKLYPLQIIRVDLKLKKKIKCWYTIYTYYLWWWYYFGF